MKLFKEHISLFRHVLHRCRRMRPGCCGSLFSPPVGWRVYSPLMRPSVCLSVTTERLSKLRKITGKKQARFPLRPQWPPVTGSKKFTVVGGAFFLTCDPPTRRVTVKKTVSYDRKKRGWGWGGRVSRVSRVVGDSSGESVGWSESPSDSGLFAAVPGNNTRKWVLKQNRHTVQRRGGCRGGEPRKLLFSPP